VAGKKKADKPLSRDEVAERDNGLCAGTLSLGRKLAKGDKVTARSLNNVYGPYGADVLSSINVVKRYTPTRAEAEAQKKRVTYYVGVGQLPSASAYNEAKVNKYKVSVADAIAGAYGDVESLAGECREIVDNAPEGLSQTERIQTFETTADTLENIGTGPDLPSDNEKDEEDAERYRALSKISIIDYPDLSGRESRASQASNIGGTLRLCAEAIEEFIDGNDSRKATVTALEKELREKKRDRPTDDMSALCALIEKAEKEVFTDDVLDWLKEVANEVSGHADEVEGCEFPGMYG
jgi:hypothetical protein